MLSHLHSIRCRSDLTTRSGLHSNPHSMRCQPQRLHLLPTFHSSTLPNRAGGSSPDTPDEASPPVDNGPSTDDLPTFMVQYSAWNACSKPCDGGIQAREQYCMRVSDGAKVGACGAADRFCRPRLELLTLRCLQT